MLVAVGGLHGNEPAGPEAIRRVLDTLAADRAPLRGTLVGLAGHPSALQRDVRYFERDLNRLWTAERVGALRGCTAPDRFPGFETREQAALLALLDGLREEAGEREIHFLDLHTTSSESVPFLTFSDSLESRALARHLPLPSVLGVEEEIEGTLLDHLDSLGHAGVCVEGGRHRDPRSADRLEAAIWLTLVGLEMLDPVRVPDLETQRARLAAGRDGIPRLFEVRYRHALREGDGFRMRPGYRNFRKVRRNEWLAEDRLGPVHAPIDGRIFLPLYQTKGEEGFFLVRQVSPLWLGLSGLLRRLGAARLAPRLPGVHPHPRREGTVLVRPTSAPLLVRLLHLLGYRRERSEDGFLVLSRRLPQKPRSREASTTRSEAI